MEDRIDEIFREAAGSDADDTGEPRQDEVPSAAPRRPTGTKRQTLFQKKVESKRRRDELDLNNKRLKGELISIEIYKRQLETF